MSVLASSFRTSVQQGVEFKCFSFVFVLFLLSSDEGEKQDDYEVAEKTIFSVVEDAEKKALHAARRAEQAVEHAIQDEVDTIFPSEHKRNE